MQAPQVWEQFGVRGEGMIIAVLDSGVDPDHPDLAGKMAPTNNWAEFNTSGALISSAPHDASPCGHGTAVTSTIVGGDTAGDYLGIVPEAQFIHVKVLDEDGFGTSAQVAAGINWAATTGGADVIVMSFGVGHGLNSNIGNAVANAADLGVMCVAAAGNDGLGLGELCEFTTHDGTIKSPAAETYCIAVGGVERQFSKDPVHFTLLGTIQGNGYPMSSAGYVAGQSLPKPDVVAPAESLLAAEVGGGRMIGHGTSGAAPLVGGVAAMMLSASENLRYLASNEVFLEVRAAFRQSAVRAAEQTYPFACEGQRPWPNKYYGYGFLMAADAMSALENGLIVDWVDVTGVVKDAQDRPISGATLRFESMETTNRPTIQSVESGTTGDYRITVEGGTRYGLWDYGPRDFSITVERPPFIFQPQGITTDWNGESQEVDLTADPVAAVFLVSGYVRDQSGVGVEAVRINGFPHGAPVTDANGYYVEYVTSGWSGSVAPESGTTTFWPDQIVVPSVTEDTQLENLTHDVVAIYGHVRDGAGAGIQGIDLSIPDGGASSWSVADKVTTDSTGYYELIMSTGTPGFLEPQVKGSYNSFTPADSPLNLNDHTLQNFTAFDVTTTWQTDGLGVCYNPHRQTFLNAIPTSDGGMIVCWSDNRNLNDGRVVDIFAQKVSADGDLLWSSEGVTVCDAAYRQTKPVIIADGLGGAIIAWEDERAGNTWCDIYAQRIDSAGLRVWSPANGKPICTAVWSQSDISMVADSEGAILAWTDKRGGSGAGTADIYAQKIDLNGDPVWQTDGVIVCGANRSQSDPSIVSDGLGGAILVWRDHRSGMNYDLFAGRITALNGTSVWNGTSGVAVSTPTDWKDNPSITADDSFGAIIVWQDYSSAGGANIYGQRFDNLGSRLWPDAGQAISADPGHQLNPQVLLTSAGECIVSWLDNGAGTSIMAKKLDGSGQGMWTESLSSGPAYWLYGGARLITDGAGGAIATWQDARGADWDIYAQRVDENGIVMWQTDGEPISTYTDEQNRHRIVSDGTGGAIIAWNDYRDGDGDIYAMRVGQSEVSVPATVTITNPPLLQTTCRNVTITNTGLMELRITSVNGCGSAPFSLNTSDMDSTVPVGGSTAFQVCVTPTDTGQRQCTVTVQSNAVNNPVTTLVKLRRSQGGGRWEFEDPPPVAANLTPGVTGLGKNAPNPFNPTTIIPFSLSKSQHVSLVLYDVRGTVIRRLVDGSTEAGIHTIEWDGTDDLGRAQASGTYFAVLKTEDERMTLKMMMMQ